MPKKRSDYFVIPRDTLSQLYYYEGLDSNQIAARFGVSPRTILNRMREYGMARRGHADYVYIDIPQADLYRLYVEEGLPTTAIAKIFGVASSLISDRMKTYGIPVRRDGWDKVKQIVPAERLEWSAEFAYAVGLITADGNLRQNGNEVKLYSTDHELIENYCRALGLRPDTIAPNLWHDPTAIPIHVIQESRYQQANSRYKPQYGIVFSDYAYRARLEQIGLTPNKSKTLQPLDIPNAYFRDFLRGLFDGDGCWHVTKAKSPQLIALLTSGSEIFRIWILHKIREFLSISTGTIVGIEVRFTNFAAEKLGAFLYNTSNNLSLTRKRKIWEDWMAKRYPDIKNPAT